MRDLGFRAWIDDSSLCNDIEIESHLDELGNFIPFMQVLNDWYMDDGQTLGDFLSSFGKGRVMQYTGLKDRNGVKVYEGDLIACYKNTTEGIAYIYWDEDMKVVLVKDLGDYGGIVETLDMVDESKFVVIGNIYENPELMEVD